MSQHTNEFGQPIGTPLPSWTPCTAPHHASLVGQYSGLVPFDLSQHVEPLFDGFQQAPNNSHWTYLGYGPFPNLDAFRMWAAKACLGNDPLFFTVIDRTDQQPVGLTSYLRITPDWGTIEVGHIHFTPRLARTRAATEAMFLMMDYAFRLGYRRYEWKCDALNLPSRKAALRLGFTFEGVFRNAMIYKNRSRDTAWYAITDDDWPTIRSALTRWLHPDNFDDAGQQRASLATFFRGGDTQR